MNLYRDESSRPKWNAQRNLSGRTHYVDDDTLRFHKSRILSTHITDSGLLFALVESVALTMDGSKRGYRPVIFDVFGNTVERPKLEDSFKSRKAATSAMWDALNKLDAKQITREALDRQEQSNAREIKEMRETLAKIK